MSPLTWIRSLKREEQLELLAKSGSLKVLANQISCSESALRPIFMGQPKKELGWEDSFEVEALFERYKSVRCVAYMLEVKESLVRKAVEDLGMDVATLIDYSRGDNHNSKGRRAELQYAEYRGENILEDLNLTKGSQADFDFLDKQFGRVNVKSSRRYKWKASTRKRAPYYWKISTNGWDKADTLVVMAYDDKMQNLLGVQVLKAEDCGHVKTLTLVKDDLEEIECLTNWLKPLKT